MASDHVERYREALDAWNRRDLVWILEQAAPDLEFHTAQLFPGIEPAYEGREGMVEFWTTFIEEPWALFRLEVESLDAAGDDRVLALLTFHGTERDSGEEVTHAVRPPRDLPRRRGRAHRRLRRLGRGPRAPPACAWSLGGAPARLDRDPARGRRGRGRLLGAARVRAGRVARGARRRVTWVERAGHADPPDRDRGRERPRARATRPSSSTSSRARSSASPPPAIEVAEARELWGARRAFAISPGGHRVELMESPPPCR